MIKDSVPSIDLLRFTSTGTETAQTAVRLARAFTGRSRIILFEGHYHGSSDATYHRYHASPEDLDRARSGVVSGTAGMGGAPRDAIVIPFNDTDALMRVMNQHDGDIAAIMLEPVMGNAGVIPPDPGYLEFVREAASSGGAVLIFDEVITGFRIARGGAQERFGVAADITMLSKALSGGVPLGAVGGRAEIMQLMVDGTVFHGGVYSGNPMSLAAALAAQRAFEEDGEAIYRRLEASSAYLADGLRRIFADAGIPCLVQRVGGMLSCWILREVGGAPRNYRDVARIADHDRFIRFQHAAQRHGVYFHPNQYEPWYVATVHTPEIIDSVLERLRAAIHSVGWTGSD
jgi:glutamate-1-semialdehyde 2,1-aminomutase